MPTSDVPPQRRHLLVAVRWALIALCASFILFSDRMAGRLGFAALLLLAVIVGRYANRRRTRVLTTENQLPSPPQSATQPATSDTDLPRREAGH